MIEFNRVLFSTVKASDSFYYINDMDEVKSISYYQKVLWCGIWCALNLTLARLFRNVRMDQSQKSIHLQINLMIQSYSCWKSVWGVADGGFWIYLDEWFCKSNLITIFCEAGKGFPKKIYFSKDIGGWVLGLPHKRVTEIFTKNTFCFVMFFM